MAQHDYVIDNASGAAVRADINLALKAILTTNSGPEPNTDTGTVDTPIAYMLWADTSVSPNLLKIRDSSNGAWITICEIASGGVGTLASGQVYIGDGTVAAPGLAFKDDVDTGLRRSSTGDFSIVVGGDRKLTIDTNGNVGIGNNSPAVELHVENSTGNCVLQIISDTDDSSLIRLGDTGDVNIGKIEYDHSNNSLAFDTNNSTRLTIDSSGNLDVAGGNIINGSPALGSSGYDLQNNGVHKLARDTIPGNSVLKVMGASGSSGGELRVKGDGDCENTLGNYDQINSDERLKENIVDASSQWEDIKGIRFRNFNYISNPNTRILGCVAQELQQVCPSLIKTRPASEEEIADNSNTISQGDQVLSFKQIPLLLKAAKALQEAMERIETLETKVAALEAGS